MEYFVSRDTSTQAPRNPDPNAEKYKELVPYLMDILNKRKYQWSLIENQNAADPAHRLNSQELELWNRFSKPVKPKSDESDDGNDFVEDRSEPGRYVYFQPIRAEDSCLGAACHYSPAGGGGAFDANLLPMGKVGAQTPGELLAVCMVSMKNEDTDTALNQNNAILLAAAIVTVFLAMLASYIIVRYVIVKPLRHLRDVSDSISRGDISQRADIHTGDEFEELAVAFNRMLRHLTTIQEELQQVNASLDGKVDELAQVNMRLYEMNMLKSDFLSTMSHELRTPLNSILGFSDVLGSIDALDEKQKRYVQNIQKSGRTLLDMINDILDLAKMESGKMQTRLTEFPLGQVVGAQCDMARPLSEKKNIDLAYHLPPDLPPMRQDQARVQQILNNLLSNAIKFTPEGGRITIFVERDERDFLVMKISDTGVGIAEDDQQTIFEKFRQGRTAMPGGDAMTREHSGTGLGLSIVKELCKLLGGEISVQSELGKGSTFTVRLPWRLEEQPRLDSSLIDDFSDLGKPRIDFVRG
jgi:signal transduction histidine kinase